MLLNKNQLTRTRDETVVAEYNNSNSTEGQGRCEYRRKGASKTRMRTNLDLDLEYNKALETRSGAGRACDLLILQPFQTLLFFLNSAWQVLQLGNPVLELCDLFLLQADGVLKLCMI